jgi:redox-sensitive bicupin YhaK (pirin superfamily)
MTAPRYQELTPDEIPVVTADGATVRVIAGRHAGITGPVATNSPVTYLHVTLAAGASVEVDVPADQNVGVYTFAGDGDGTLTIHDHDGDVVTVVNRGEDRSEHLVMAGQPLGEPVARYGPFVMNTREEIVEAIDDFNTGRFGAIAR